MEELGAPAEVSSVSVDASTLTGNASGAVVSDITGNQALVQFSRSDLALPITFGLLASQWGVRIVPGRNIDAYRLTVTNL
jgi:hypothetical protein